MGFRHTTARDGCGCKGHPFNCIGHPTNCGCLTIPEEYLPRAREVILQGIGALGRPRGVKHGAETDEYLMRLVGLRLSTDSQTGPNDG